MIHSLNTVAKALQLLVQGGDLVVDIDDLTQSHAYNELKNGSIATRTTLLFFSIANLAIVLSGQSHRSLARGVKSIEPLAHIIAFPTKMIETIEVFDHPHASTVDKVKVIEKKILGSLISFARSVCESELTWQRHYRDLPLEEQGKLQFPVHQNDEDSYRIVGYEVFDKEKCVKAITNLESCIPKMNGVEVSTETNLGSRVIGVSASAFNLLIAHIAAHFPPPAPPHRSAPVVAPASLSRPSFESHISEDEWLNLSHWKVIPVELHEDEVFKQFICAITNLPIRDIVQDPTLEASSSATQRPQPIYYE